MRRASGPALTPLAGSEWPTLPFPLIAFASPETPAGLEREGGAVTLILDFAFLLVFLAVMFAYDRRKSLWDSWQLSLIAVGLPGVIALISLLVAPLFRQRLDRQFMLGARKQSFLTDNRTRSDLLRRRLISA